VGYDNTVLGCFDVALMKKADSPVGQPSELAISSNMSIGAFQVATRIHEEQLLI
jgi:hypothetical protein